MPDVNNERMESLRCKCDALETLRRMPLPTPEIGHTVLFHRHGDMNAGPIPGIVVLQGGPGQVDLKLFVRNSHNQENVTGIHYESHPFVKSNPQVLKLKGGGCWSYKEGDKATVNHQSLHVAEIDRQLKNLREELLREREQQMRRDALDKEIAAKPEKSAKAEKVGTS